MTRKRDATRPASIRARAARPTAEPATDRVVARPEGYYWVADDGRQEFGPYPTAAQALAAAGEAADTAADEEEALQQAEADIGVAERLDHDIAEVDEQTGAGGERS
jgi:hypothetical protein